MGGTTLLTWGPVRLRFSGGCAGGKLETRRAIGAVSNNVGAVYLDCSRQGCRLVDAGNKGGKGITELASRVSGRIMRDHCDIS